MSLPDLLNEIRDDLRALPSVKRVYEGVPDAINEFPAVIVAAMGARCWLSSHGRNGIAPLHCQHDIRVEIHIPRKDLEQDAATMTAIAEDASITLYAGFATDRYNGTMVTTGNPQTSNNATAPLTYTIGPSQWAGQQTYAMLADFAVTTSREVTT